MIKQVLAWLTMLCATTALVSSPDLDYTSYLNNSLRGKIPGLTLDFNKLDEPIVTVLPYGYVQLEFHADSRQVVGTFEDLSAFYPEAITLDPNGEDIFAHPEAHLTPRRTNMGVLLIGPQGECFSSMGVIETDFTAIARDFYGDTVSPVSSLRLRHAFGYLNWSDDWAILLGHYWHPLAEPECWPETLDGVGAGPVEIGARDPQIRFIKNFGATDIMLTLLSQLDFQSFGPFGAVTNYIRNAVVPNINLKFTTDLDWIFFGASLDYKRLVPRIFSDIFFNSDNHVDSFIGEGFFKLNFENLILRFKGAYVQNGADQGALSGYAIRTENPITDIDTYTPIACWLVWSDLMYYLDYEHMHQLGVYAGFTKNLGSKDELFIPPTFESPVIYTIPQENQFVDYVLKVIPRYVFVLEPFVVGCEIALSRAAFGTPDKFARIQNPVPVNNVRVTIQFNYVF